MNTWAYHPWQWCLRVWGFFTIIGHLCSRTDTCKTHSNGVKAVGHSLRPWLCYFSIHGGWNSLVSTVHTFQPTPYSVHSGLHLIILLCVVYSSFSQQHFLNIKIHTYSQSNPIHKLILVRSAYRNNNNNISSYNSEHLNARHWAECFTGIN